MSDALQREQTEALRAVRKAARLCRAVGLGIRPEILDKKDKSPVTVADFGSQALICRALAEAFPDDPIIAEEDSAELRRAENAAILAQVVEHVRAIEAGSDPIARRRLRLDRPGGDRRVSRPVLDRRSDRWNERIPPRRAVRRRAGARGRGTGRGRRSGVPELELDEQRWRGRHGAQESIFTAVRGQGAFAVPMDQDRDDDLRSVPIRVSENDDPAAARFCESVESGHSAHGDAAAIATRLGIVAPPVRMDSQAKYGVVARGEAEIYLRMPTRADYREKIWDHAAGALIVEEAGGTVTDITGRPLEFHHGRELSANRGVIATNGRLHMRVIEVLSTLGLA